MPLFLTTRLRLNQWKTQKLYFVSRKNHLLTFNRDYTCTIGTKFYGTTKESNRIHHTIRRTNRFYTETKSCYKSSSFYARPVSQESLSSAISALKVDKDDDHDHHVSPFNQLSGTPLENTAAAVRFLRQRKQRIEKSSLDLELGEGLEKISPWMDEDDQDYEDEPDEWIFDRSYDYLSDGPHTQRNTGESAEKYNALDNDYTEWSTSNVDESDKKYLSATREKHETNVSLSMLDAAEESNVSDFTKKKSAFEYMKSFDPIRPPSSNNLEALQIWLECETQQETVLRFQKVIDDARERKDYSSLSMVQKQIIRWFEPLKEEISTRQRAYILKELDENSTYEGSKRYGPFLCALPPSKLAVIAAHETIICTLLKNTNGHKGVPFATLAKRIGEAVEDEVVIHRVLHKRFKESQLRANTSGLFDKTKDTEGSLIDEKFSDTPSDKEPEPENEYSEGSNKSSAAHEWTYSSTHLKGYLDEISKLQPSAKKRRVVRYAIRRARSVLEKDEEWSVEDKVQLGAALFEILFKTATVSVDGKDELAFNYEKRWTKKDRTQSFVSLHESIYNMFVDDKLHSFAVSATRFKPMIVPPKPWTKLDQGGYSILRADLLRFHGCNIQKEVLALADLSVVFDGLNALGSVKWKVNKKILQVAKECWERDIPIGDIATRTDFDLPPEPIRPEMPKFLLDKESEDYKIYKEEQQRFQEALAKFNRIKQKNMDLRSLRCSAVLKLDQAEKFQDFEHLYFPYNMDFRGRAYPIPPHLSNVGSDLCRGILYFAESKPLGERGFYWLKVHLANFAGKDKMSFDERAQFVDKNLEQIRDSVRIPFDGERWWMSLEDPFQGLATCHEIIAAIDSGDPTTYRCSLPVHMDGSCNGLQHYAALGRDMVGGKAVNLCATSEPQDVYVGVMHEVVKRVANEAKRDIDFDTSDVTKLSAQQKKDFHNNRSAKLVNGLIDRGVVKRTVMTSVYGVTFIGARQQIQEKIEDKVRLDLFIYCKMMMFLYRALTLKYS